MVWVGFLFLFSTGLEDSTDFRELILLTFIEYLLYANFGGSQTVGAQPA